jgi:hypothetical protein
VRFRRFARLTSEDLTADQVSAVVREDDRKGICRRVGLEFHDGRCDIIERSSEHPSTLPDLAQEIAAALGVPIKSKPLPFFWV